MDLKDIQNLIRFVSKAEVAEVKYKDKDFEISIKTNSYVPNNVQFAQPTPIQNIPQITPSPELKKEEEVTKTENNSKYVTIKSPMIGTYYRKSGPDKPLLINEGDQIVAGKVICIIEAMKLFNEIEAEISGKVIKILVDDSSPVEYDQPLFLIDPS